jgi:peptidoglycan/xylan/chitin deacetylase (PgdA/CDA1 family)
MGSGTEILAQDAAPQARIAKFADDRAAAISYTFDDNLRDQYTLAVPMLNEFGFKGTFFVIPGATAETPDEGKLKADRPRAWGGISWPELKEMSDEGHEIASHTWSHPNLQKLPVEEVDAQFGKASGAITSRIGKPPLTVAFPFNASTPELKAAALKYHVAYRSYQTSVGGKSSVTSINAWADVLVEEKKWGVMMIHGIEKGYAALSDPEILRHHFAYVKSHERDVWVDTFANVARYEKERDDAKLEFVSEGATATCVIRSTLDPQRYNVPLTLVISAASATSASAERAAEALPVRVRDGAVYVQAAPNAQPITVRWK